MQLLAKAQLEAQLRVALEQNQLRLFYQAQVTATGLLAGAEALVRWQHPERGLVPPAEFIPLAEQTGLIVPIGAWVLETACQQLAAWDTPGSTQALTLSVNVSAVQFRRPDFVDQVVAAISQTGVNPARLKLELTESLMVDDVEDVIAKMTSLKTLGVGFSMDDFGTGYSSLAYLSRLPLDQLKIDQGFVRDIESSDTAAVICAATISLAHSLKLKVVAEGVETLAQQYFLSTVHQCDFLQGYLFCKPLPLAEFEILLNESRFA
jgi:EAL domain-containing protein (putative c-di-GMP-specific phosphodiesterase class I)